jgi:hypothetical protein
VKYDIKAAQGKFKETITDTLDRQLQGVRSIIWQMAKDLCEVSSEPHVIQ